MHSMRTRWAAIGAVVAITVGASGLGVARATNDAGDGPVSAFFPIEPCRLADNAAITADSSIGLNGWGETGDCDLPDGITGLAANVTAVNATAQTNLRFYAQGEAIPETANLNPSPGASPTPNAVDIGLNPSNGQFRVYNRFGSVGVFIDVMGYYDDHTHDDRYYTEDEIDAMIQALRSSLSVAVTAGHGEGVGGSSCPNASSIEMAVRDATGGFANHRFSFIVPEFGHGQIRSDGSIRQSGFAAGVTATLSVVRSDTGRYCLTFSGDQPSESQRESTVAAVMFEN